MSRCSDNWWERIGILEARARSVASKQLLESIKATAGGHTVATGGISHGCLCPIGHVLLIGGRGPHVVKPAVRGPSGYRRPSTSSIDYKHPCNTRSQPDPLLGPRPPRRSSNLLFAVAMTSRPRSLSMGDAMRLRAMFPHTAVRPSRDLVQTDRARECVARLTWSQILTSSPQSHR